MNRGVGKVLARSSRSLSVWLAVLLSFSLACVRPTGVLHGTDATSSNTQELPFQVGQSSNGTAPSDDSAPAVPANSNPSNALPFRVALHPRSLQQGTLLTVELGTSLVPAKIRPGDVFPATVTDPVMFDGATLVDAGTAVTGRVESAQMAGQQASPRGSGAGVPRAGYVRLTLSAIVVDGKPIALQTLSLFARATLPHSAKSSPSDGASADAAAPCSVERGRHLTFRLTAPLNFDVVGPLANRQSPVPVKQQTKE